MQGGGIIPLVEEVDEEPPEEVEEVEEEVEEVEVEEEPPVDELLEDDELDDVLGTQRTKVEQSLPLQQIGCGPTVCASGFEQL